MPACVVQRMSDEQKSLNQTGRKWIGMLSATLSHTYTHSKNSSAVRKAVVNSTHTFGLVLQTISLLAESRLMGLDHHHHPPTHPGQHNPSLNPAPHKPHAPTRRGDAEFFSIYL